MVTKSSKGLENVVPLAGTWIETCIPAHPRGSYPSSFPLRERGLKREESGCGYFGLRSFPLRERGLKLTDSPKK